MRNTNKSAFLNSALLGCDWYVNSQVVNQKPWWDNNHGRFIYTMHIPTGLMVRGICWTQARGIMCCLSAYESTNNKKYLETAERAARYIFNLQVLDERDPRSFGAIHEEIYCSETSYIRDASEATDALVCLYRITRNREYLYRAELWADWCIRNAIPKHGLPLLQFNFINGQKKESGFSFSGAVAMSFYHLYKATKKSKYKSAFKKITDAFIKRFIRSKDGAILSGTFAAHHAGKGAEIGVAMNDDGGGVQLLQAYNLFNNITQLQMAVNYGDYILRQPLPYGIFAAHPGRFNFLVELSNVTGNRKYSEYVKANIDYMLKLQYLKKGDKMVYGAFRGEDEPAEWYASKKAKGIEFVNNRMTAYSVMTLFKMHGKVKGPYYSSLAW